MLNEKEIINLLKKALEKYILHLENSSLYYTEYEGQITAYLKVLNRHDLNIRYLDINTAKELLNRI